MSSSSATVALSFTFASLSHGVRLRHPPNPTPNTPPHPNHHNISTPHRLSMSRLHIPGPHLPSPTLPPLLDHHDIESRNWIQSPLFNPRIIRGRRFVSPDYNQRMEQQREMTMRRIE
ncbi:putative acyl-coenzyme A oxidase 3.2, peroxisomal [Drosera capensis]